MALKSVLFIAALVAQECTAVPVVLPTSLFPSLTVTGIPLPTGAKLDIPRRDQDEQDLPPFLPTLTGLPSLTGLPALPTGLSQRDEGEQNLPPFLPTLTGLPSLTGLPALPTGLPLPTSTASLGDDDDDADLVEKRQQFSSDVPQSVATLSEPTGSSYLPRRAEPTVTVPLSITASLATGIPSKLPTLTGLPTSLPTGPLTPGGLLQPDGN